MSQDVFNGAAMASFALVSRLFALLIERGIITREEVRQILEQAADAHREDGPAIDAARQLIEQMAAPYQRGERPAKH